MCRYSAVVTERKSSTITHVTVRETSVYGHTLLCVSNWRHPLKPSVRHSTLLLRDLRGPSNGTHHAERRQSLGTAISLIVVIFQSGTTTQRIRSWFPFNENIFCCSRLLRFTWNRRVGHHDANRGGGGPHLFVCLPAIIIIIRAGERERFRVSNQNEIKSLSYDYRIHT